MKTRAWEYLAKALQYEQRAKKMRNQEEREWHLCLARAYRMLAEMESEVATRGPVAAGNS
jgi:hypothetical protein